MAPISVLARNRVWIVDGFAMSGVSERPTNEGKCSHYERSDGTEPSEAGHTGRRVRRCSWWGKW